MNEGGCFQVVLMQLHRDLNHPVSQSGAESDLSPGVPFPDCSIPTLGVVATCCISQTNIHQNPFFLLFMPPFLAAPTILIAPCSIAMWIFLPGADLGMQERTEKCKHLENIFPPHSHLTDRSKEFVSWIYCFPYMSVRYPKDRNSH